MSKRSSRKGGTRLAKRSCLGRLGTAVPSQHFLNKTCSPDVSTPQIDRVFYLFGKLKDCSGFAGFWCAGNFHCWDINPCLVLTCNLQFKQTGSKERNEILIASKLLHLLPTPCQPSSLLPNP